MRRLTCSASPASLLDLGCGEGALVFRALALGIDAMGVDVAVAAPDPVLVYADLRQPLDLGRRFTWVCCWEVAEHLPDHSAWQLVQTCVDHLTPDGRILFTAARVGQRGPGHINCQPPTYWADLFAEFGLTVAEQPSADLRRAWASCAPRCPWYGQNAYVFWRVA